MYVHDAEAPEKDRRSGALLVVTDDPRDAADIDVTLRGAGFDPTATNSAEAALKACVGRKFDLAILGHPLPNANTPELARRLLREHGVHCIFLSAPCDENVVRQAVSAGAIGYLMRPVPLVDVLPTVHTALARAAELRTLHARQSELSESLIAARDINTAVGVLMERLHLQQEAAFECLRRYARSHRKRVVDVAREMLQPLNNANRTILEIARHVDPACDHDL